MSADAGAARPVVPGEIVTGSVGGELLARRQAGEAGPSLPGEGAWARTTAFTAGLALLGVVLLAPVASAVDWAPAPERLSWWQLAMLFAVAEVLVFHVEIRDEAHSFSFSEVPLLLGLVFAGPWALVAARLSGEAVALLGVERQRPAKLAFNLALFLAETSLALTVFRLLGEGRTPADPALWLAGLAAVGLSGVFGNVAIWQVIRWHGETSAIRPMLFVAVVTTVCNASLAVVAAVLATRAAWALPALAVIVLAVVGAYREYGRLTRRYTALELLSRFTRMTGDAVPMAEAIGRVLDEARSLLRAQSAWLVLTEPDGTRVVGADPPRALAAIVGQLLGGPPHAVPDVVVAPAGTREARLRGALVTLDVRDLLAAPLRTGSGNPVGALVVANRLGHVSTFDAEDARLFTALAAQAGVALENGRLVARLHDQVKAREHASLHDVLTGLPNRTLFARQLEAACGPAARPGAPAPGCAVLLMDLDQFKEVNDTLGHATGDRLLQEVGRRLQVAVGGRGLVSRLGGDEFAVVIAGPVDTAAATALAQEVHAAVTEPVQLDAVKLAVGASIGIAVHPMHGADPSSLLQRADVAMYAAKRARDRVTVYNRSSDWNSELRLRLAGEIPGALQSRQFGVHYQPIVRARDGRIVMVEALARWHHPELGELLPDQFIPIAERTGMIEPLTRYVLEAALAQCRQWQGAGLDVRVAVNLSIQVMVDEVWPQRVLDLLRQTGVDARRLVLEITETTIMSDPSRTVPALRRLADAGVQVGIDDFGTGYSSLSYLQRLPVSEIKIDKSFVAPLSTDPTRCAIVRSVVDLAHSLGMSTVAEGVADRPTLDYLTGIGCDLVQGHWLSRPLPADRVTVLLAGGTLPLGDAPTGAARPRVVRSLDVDAAAAAPHPPAGATV